MCLAVLLALRCSDMVEKEIGRFAAKQVNASFVTHLPVPDYLLLFSLAHMHSGRAQGVVTFLKSSRGKKSYRDLDPCLINNFHLNRDVCNLASISNRNKTPLKDQIHISVSVYA